MTVLICSHRNPHFFKISKDKTISFKTTFSKYTKKEAFINKQKKKRKKHERFKICI